MMARDIRRQLDGTQTFLASGVRVFTIPTDTVLKEINLQLRVGITGDAVTASSGPFIDSPFTNIKRIDLIANGKDVIKSFPGLVLHQLNQLDFGAYQMIDDITPATSTSSGRLDYSLTIPLASYGMADPSITLLDTRKFSSLNMNITFGAGVPDIYGTVGATNDIDNFDVTPWGHEVLDLGEKSAFSIFQEITNRETTGATSATEQQVKMTTGPLYRAILLSERDSNERALAGSTAGRILDVIKVRESGTFIRRHWDNRVLSAHQMIRHQLAQGMGFQDGPEIFETTDGTAVNGSRRPGISYLNFAEDGRVSSLLDTRRATSLELLLDYGGDQAANTTDLILITSRSIIPAA